MKKCEKCINARVRSNEVSIDYTNQWLIPVLHERQVLRNIHNAKQTLFKCQKCETHWEWRPLHEESMYGGEPGEWVKVSSEYVDENYKNKRP